MWATNSLAAVSLLDFSEKINSFELKRKHCAPRESFALVVVISYTGNLNFTFFSSNHLEVIRIFTPIEMFYSMVTHIKQEVQLIGMGVSCIQTFISNNSQLLQSPPVLYM